MLPVGATSTNVKLNLLQERELMEAWALSMPPHMEVLDGSARATLSKLGIRPAVVQGIRVGDWHSLMMRLRDADSKVKVKNEFPFLEEGNYIEIVAGNSVKYECVGQRGVLKEYFRGEQKWGIDLDEDGDPSLIHKNNLKRLAKTRESYVSAK